VIRVVKILVHVTKGVFGLDSQIVSGAIMHAISLSLNEAKSELLHGWSPVRSLETSQWQPVELKRVASTS
jgi:hypothetical protein